MLPEADAETKIQVKVFGGRRPQEWGKREVRQGREGSEWWYMVLYRASHLGGQLELTAARAAEREKNVPQCFPG